MRAFNEIHHEAVRLRKSFCRATGAKCAKERLKESWGFAAFAILAPYLCCGSTARVPWRLGVFALNSENRLRLADAVELLRLALNVEVHEIEEHGGDVRGQKEN
jgi:hypothetical protein